MSWVLFMMLFVIIMRGTGTGDHSPKRAIILGPPTKAWWDGRGDRFSIGRDEWDHASHDSQIYSSNMSPPE